jgi:VWFA-related protein
MRLPFLSCSPPVLVFCCVASLCAQSSDHSAQEQIPTIKAEARAVVVDVVVTDSHGNPVSGLHEQDFRVIEDGKPESVVFFEEHKGAAAIPIELPKMPPNVFTNVPIAPQADALNVLLLDALNTPRTDQSYVRAQVLEFLKTMTPGIPLAVFTLTTNLQFVQGFTGSPSTLLASLQDKKNGGWPEATEVSHSTNDDIDDRHHLQTMQIMLGGHSDEGVVATDQAQQNIKAYGASQRVELTAEALENLARYLARIPGRKNLIWFASRFPISFFPVANGNGALTVGRKTGGLKPAEEVGLQSGRLKETADLLTVSRVAIYPVGARGVETVSSSQIDEWDKNLAIAGESQERAEIADNYGTMGELASETGGEVIKNTNDLGKALGRAIQNGSHYYTLSYTPTNKTMDGQFRRIEIKLSEGKYTMSYRRGYYAFDSATAQSSLQVNSKGNVQRSAKSDTKLAQNPLQPLMQRGAPSSTQILYGLRVLPVNPQPGQDAVRAGANAKLTGAVTRYSVDFMIRWTDVNLELMPDGTHRGRIQVEIIAYDRDGKALNWVGGTMGMNIKSDLFTAIQRSGLPAHLEIDVPKGEAYLATGVYDWNTAKVGTLEVPLDAAKIHTASIQDTTPGAK